MYDFSWGKTRTVGGSAVNNAAVHEKEEGGDKEDGYKEPVKGYGSLSKDDISVPSAVCDDCGTTSSSINSSSI